MIFQVTRLFLMAYFLTMFLGAFLGVSTIKTLWTQGMAINADTQAVIAQMEAEAFGYSADDLNRMEPASGSSTSP